MEQREKIFQWKDPRPGLIFPIDYTSKEMEREFGLDSRMFRNHALRNTLIIDILQELSPPEDKADSFSKKGIMPPIPLEAVPFLKCFFQLAEQVEKGYHHDFFIRSPKPTDDIQPFWLDLCKSLYDQTAPVQESEAQDIHAFCRHILFQNDKFISSLLSTLWESTVQPRCNDIIKAAKQVSLQNQIWALKICLTNLDFLYLNLQSQIRIPSDSKSLSTIQPSDIRELLKNLLASRQKNKTTIDELITYNLPDISLADGTTLGSAFKSISRRGKSSEKTKPMLLMARQAYLSHLAKEIEADSSVEEPLKLERQYIDIQNYLEAPSSLKLDALHKKIQESCKEYCRQVIGYCTYKPTFKDNPPPPTFQPYTDDLFESLVYGRMNQALSCFQETFLLVASHNTGRTAAYSDQFYERAKLFHLESFIKEHIKAKKDSDLLLSELYTLLGDIKLTLPSNFANPFHQDMLGFFPYFQGAWKFIYNDATPLFKEETFCFQNIGDVAHKLWKDAGSAAQFFSNEKRSFEHLSFPSQEEAVLALVGCEKIASNPEIIFAPVRFWDSISNILQALLLQILQKVVHDQVPQLVEYMKPLFIPHEKPVS